MEETLNVLKKDKLSSTRASTSLLMAGFAKFCGGWLLCMSLPAILPEESYTIISIFIFSLMYLIIVGPVYLKSILKLVFSAGKAAMAVLLFYFLLFTCWGFWDNSGAGNTVEYLVLALSTGLGGALLAGFVMLSKKAGWILIVAPFALAAKLGRRLTSIVRKT